MDNYSRSQKINDYAADHGGDTPPAATVADATIAQTYAILALVDAVDRLRLEVAHDEYGNRS